MPSGSLSTLTPDPTTGYIPTGRHRVTEDEIRAEFVDGAAYSASTTRADIWDEYELARDLLRRKVRIHAVWIGGSFLTTKVEAKDIDALFIVSGRDYRRSDTAGQQVVNSFLPQLGPLGQTVRGHGFTRVDSYLLMWSPFSPFDPENDPAHVQYAVRRGYWDDWWPRERHNKPDGKPPHWKDALPVRGYLEVELDAYDR